MNQEEQEDRVWDLLTHAKAVEPSPLFVRRVLREVRQLESTPTGFRAWLSGIKSLLVHRPVFIGATACAVLILILLPLFNRDIFFEASPPTFALLDDPAHSFDPALEMATIEYLGQLMAVVDPGQLDDDSLAELFF